MVVGWRTQVFDQTGIFQRQFFLPSRHSSSSSASGSRWCPPSHPHGLCVIDNTGLVAICDRDSHRVVLMTYDGADAGDLLTADDGLRYPCDVAVSAAEGQAGGKQWLVAVIESSSGLLGNEPHHAVKLFAV